MLHNPLSPVFVEVERDVRHLRTVVRDDVTEEGVADDLLFAQLVDKTDRRHGLVQPKLVLKMSTE